MSTRRRVAIDGKEGAWTIATVSVDHYENFPVASWLCPPALRPAIVAIYRFARTADDIADEGDASPESRLADLGAYRSELAAIDRFDASASRWPGVFGPLREAVDRHALPLPLLADLLSAFEQDVVKRRYADRVELLDYCRRSANPVGRLLLHLYGIHDAEASNRSDAVCTALQLTNFWQDLGIDIRRGRLYVPIADCARYGVGAEQLLGGHDSAATRALVGDLVRWTGTLMRQGAPLVQQVAGRAGWELRLVVQGGSRILEKIESLDFATLQQRPTLSALDAPLLAWRSWRMSAARRTITSEAA